jgi:hypothetical protein
MVLHSTVCILCSPFRWLLRIFHFLAAIWSKNNSRDLSYCPPLTLPFLNASDLYFLHRVENGTSSIAMENSTAQWLHRNTNRWLKGKGNENVLQKQWQCSLQMMLMISSATRYCTWLSLVYGSNNLPRNSQSF